MAVDCAHKAECTHLADHFDLVFKSAFPTITLNHGGFGAGDLTGLIHFYPLTALDSQGNYPNRDKMSPAKTRLLPRNKMITHTVHSVSSVPL